MYIFFEKKIKKISKIYRKSEKRYWLKKSENKRIYKLHKKEIKNKEKIKILTNIKICDKIDVYKIIDIYYGGN